MRPFLFHTKLLISLVLALGFQLNLHSQSLYEKINNISKISDTETKLDSLLKLVSENIKVNTDSGRFVAQALLKQAKNANHDGFIGDALHYIGVSYAWQGKYEEAMDHYNQSLTAMKSSGDPERIALIYTSIGGVYFDQNKYLENLDYWLLAKKYALEGDNPKRVEVTNNNLGVLYMRIGKREEAKKLFQENLELGIRENWKGSMAYAYVNLSSFYLEENQLDTAELYADRAYEIYLEGENARQAASTLVTKSEIEYAKGNPKKGLEYAKMSVSQMAELKDDFNYANSLIYLGKSYLKEDNFTSARDNCLSAYKLALETNSLGVQKQSCECLSRAYYGLGKFKSAYEKEMEFQMLEDSILNDGVSTDLIRKEFAFDYKLKAEKDSLNKAKEDEIRELEHQAELKSQKSFTYFMLVLAVIALITSLYIYRNFQRKKKDNQQILLSKQIIETKNREITDSINYAKRIQTAMLPSPEVCSKVLKDYFFLYRPKDIVAGDFYWVEENANRKYFAVADCTGHGVPGAMMSVVCNNALNRAVKEFNLKEPAKILDKAREIIIEELNKGNTAEENARSIKDGMDISLGCIVEENGKRFLEYSGAYNSIFIIRKGESANISGASSVNVYDEKCLIELKGDKQPVGISHHSKAFTKKTCDLEKDDLIYCFSDGYADQFGRVYSGMMVEGSSSKPQGKKFKSSNLKKLLVKISGEQISNQHKILEDNFDKWKGDLEQLDDVCVLGVKIS